MIEPWNAPVESGDQSKMPYPAFSPPARALIVAGACALVVMLIRAAEPILAPILLAVFIAMVAHPALLWMRRRGMPKWGALAVIAFILLDVGGLLALMTTGLLEKFKSRLPAYQEKFLLLSGQFGQWAEGVGISGAREALPDLMNPDKVVDMVRLLLSSAGSLVGSGLLVLLIVLFILIEAPSVPAKLKAAFQLGQAGETQLKKLLDNVNLYMRIKVLTSLVTALSVGVMLWVLGIDFVVLWSVLAFFMNFVPIVGSILMLIPAVLVALVQTDLPTTLLVAIGYLVIQVGIGNVLEPRMMGRGLGISLLTVLIAILVWGWMLGTVGIFLAVPLTTALIIALDASECTRPFVVMLGSVTPAPAESDPGAEAAGP
jgi:AI-2 transport protein TqsA